MRGIGNWLAAAALGLGALASHAPAAAGDCWSEREVSAAKVRDFQTLLMVGALQCRTSGRDVLGPYNRFVSSSRSVIAGHNDVLKARFTRAGGYRDGQRAYDRFTTALANDHAMGATAAADFCAATAALAEQAATSSAGALEDLAHEVIAAPRGVSACAVEDRGAAIMVASKR